MSETILERIEVATKSLLQQNLWGQAIIVARIYPLIAEALTLRYKREEIYQTLVKGGLTLTLSSYINAAHRAKVAIEKGKFKATDLNINPAVNAPIQENVAPIIDTVRPQKAAVEESDNTEVKSTATHLADTLKSSVKVGQKDYSQIALKKLKQGQNK